LVGASYSDIHWCESQKCDTWLAVRQKMSFHPFHGMWDGDVAPRPRPSPRARNNCRVRGSSRRGGALAERDRGGIASLLKAASAKAPATISSEPIKAGRLSAYRNFGKISSRSRGRTTGNVGTQCIGNLSTQRSHGSQVHRECSIAAHLCSNSHPRTLSTRRSQVRAKST
jgi:hypothetical protein